MSRRTKILLPILTGAIFLYVVSCQETTIAPVSFGSLSGNVIDNFNNLPLEGVEITTNPTSSVVYTDSLVTIGLLSVLALSLILVLAFAVLR